MKRVIVIALFATLCAATSAYATGKPPVTPPTPAPVVPTTATASADALATATAVAVRKGPGMSYVTSWDLPYPPK